MFNKLFFKKRFIFLAIIAFSNLILKSSEGNESNYQNQFANNLNLINIDNTSQNNKGFLLLPNKKSINKEENIGKSDIFSFEGFENENIVSSIKLLGIYKTLKEKYAVLKHNDQIGKVKIGDIGNKDNKLIPKDYKLVEISIDKFSIKIKSRNNSFEIKG